MKPGTFTQLYIHLVFAVKHRQSEKFTVEYDARFLFEFFDDLATPTE